MHTKYIHPASHKQLTRDQSKQEARACDRYYNEKKLKYSVIAEANQLSFLPLTFESTGRMHKHTKDFLKTLANSVQEQRGISDTTLYSYFTKCLSCTLQKAVAQAFKTRITNVNRSKNCARSVVESDEFVFINNFVDGREYISQQ